MRKPISEHLEKMMEMRRRGTTLKEIGEQFGCSAERVRQLLRRHGYKGAVSVAWRRAVLQRALDLRYMRRYGCTKATYKELVGVGAPRLFRTQKFAALRRHIEWKLTLVEWVQVWTESGHLQERGRNSGEYVMSRREDRGAYELGNVFIQTCNENSAADKSLVRKIIRDRV